MPNGKNENDIIQKSDKSEDQLPTVIFTKEEIKAMVKGFLSAYLYGEITINFHSAEEIVKEAKLDGRKISVEKALDQETDEKMPFAKLVRICCDEKSGKAEEIDKATQDLFNTIVALRIAQRIVGNFYSPNIEKRLDKLEEDLAITNRTLEEFIMWLKNIEKGT